MARTKKVTLNMEENLKLKMGQIVTGGTQVERHVSVQTARYICLLMKKRNCKMVRSYQEEKLQE